MPNYKSLIAEPDGRAGKATFACVRAPQKLQLEVQRTAIPGDVVRLRVMRGGAPIAHVFVPRGELAYALDILRPRANEVWG